MGIFSRLFGFAKAEVGSALEKMDDPIEKTEQALLELKTNLQESLAALAEVKGLAIKTRKQADNARKLSEDLQAKAVQALQKMQAGEMDKAGAERLASQILARKELQDQETERLSQEADRLEAMANKLQADVNKTRSAITTYENDLITLRARARSAEASRKINQHLAKLDSSGTIEVIEKMRAKVEETEHLAAAYGELVTPHKDEEARLDAIIASAEGPKTTPLEELKKKMGLE